MLSIGSRSVPLANGTKHENVASPGLLQPLPIANKALSVISMDFTEGLPTSKGKDMILVVVDLLTKYGHFLALSHPFIAMIVAQKYLAHIYKLLGMPDSIISNRDRVFISAFWQELFKKIGTKLLLLTTYHLQTDGQTKVQTRCLEGYLRCMIGEKPDDWLTWLPLVEWWYNSTLHSFIQTTLMRLSMAKHHHNICLTLEPPLASVDRSLQAREVARKLLQFHIESAQAKMKQLADRHRSEREF